MSKRAGKRKSSLNPDALSLASIQILREALDSGPSGSVVETDTSILVSHSSTLLQLVTSNVSERKAVVHKTSGGIDILLRCLQCLEDHQVVWNSVSTLNVLAKHKHAEKLCREGALSAVLSSLSSVAHASWTTDPLLLLLHSLLGRLGTRDRKFAVKARLSGMLPVTSGLLKRCHGEQQSLITVLSVMKTLADNATNSVSFGKQGCLVVLSKVLAGVGRRDLAVMKPSVEVLSLLLKQKSNAVRPAAQLCVKQLISIHEHLHHVDRVNRHIVLRKTLVSAIKVAVVSEDCLQTFYKANGLQTLYTTATADADSKDLHSLATLTCTVLRKCLPKLPLPVTSKENPMKFQPPMTARVSGDSGIASGGDTGYKGSMMLTSRHSAPQLGGSQMALQHHAAIFLKPMAPTPAETSGPGLPRGGISSRSSSSSVDGVLQGANPSLNQECEEAINPPRSAKASTTSQEDSEVSSVAKAVAFTIGDSSPQLEVPSDLSSFDKFFPELESGNGADIFSKGAMGAGEDRNLFNRSHSYPFLSSASATVASPGNSLHPIASQDHRHMQTSLHAEAAPVSLTRDWPNVPAIVIPTADHEPVALEDEDGGVALRDKPSSFLGGYKAPFINQEDAESASIGVPPQSPKNVLQFSEHISPCTVGLAPPTDPEPFYKKTPAVDRKLTLSDVARHIAPDSLINKPVFDLYEVVRGPPEPANAGEAEVTTHPLPSSCQDGTASNAKSRDLARQDGTKQPHLNFDSRFESGNLRKAIQVCQYEYDLLLNSDINSGHYHQWFYFKVTNMVSGANYRFNIINCEKPNSQFNFGMQPLLFSLTEAQHGRPSWLRVGTNVAYFRNNYYVPQGPSGGGEVASQVEVGQPKICTKSCYTLTFTVVFPHSDDVCYLAYHYPYTYSMMLSDLSEMERELDESKVYYARQSLCTTLGGNECPLLTITSSASETAGRADDSQEGGEDPSCYGQRKQYIVLSARVHPGESNSSWVMRGVIRYLLSDDATAEDMRRKFVFKVVPMLNPDGVINGSHRCSLAGQDLNRQWIDPDPHLHPTIHSTKGLIQWLVAHNRSPLVYCDFHGHSRKKNVFMYGCRGPFGTRLEEVLPRLLDSMAPVFSFKSCSFAVEKSKEATARVVVWRRLGVARSYTMESTYCGSDQGPYKGRQVTTLDLEEMGRYFCVALSHLEDEGTAELLGEVREKEDAVGKGRGLGWSRKGVEEGQSGSSETNDDKEGSSSSEADTELPCSWAQLPSS